MKSAYRKQVHQLKRLLAEKTLEVDFFKGALQKIEARRQKSDDFWRDGIYDANPRNDALARQLEHRADV